MLTNIDIVSDLVAQAMQLSGAKTKREVVDRALREMVQRANRPPVSSLFGLGGLDPAYDHKQARGAPVWTRVEEPSQPDGAPKRGSKATAAAPKPRSAATRRKA